MPLGTLLHFCFRPIRTNARHTRKVLKIYGACGRRVDGSLGRIIADYGPVFGFLTLDIFTY